MTALAGAPDPGPGTSPIRVLIVDDQGMVRTGFGAYLAGQPDIEVVGEAADGQQAVEQAAALSPDVILMDVRMPVVDGLTATRRILAAADAAADAGAEAAGQDADAPAGPSPRIVVLTTFDLDDYVYEALRAGASGFLLKDASAGELADAVRIAARGDAVIAPAITRRLIADFAAAGGRRAPTPERVGRLTDRETEVLSLVAQGLSNGEIAAELVLAEQTVKTHVSRILAKLDLRDRAQAIVFAYESGLVQPGS